MGMEHTFALIMTGIDYPCTKRVLKKGCARSIPGSLLRLIGDLSRSFNTCSCWSGSAPYPSPHLTGENSTPAFDWDGMRENSIVSRSHSSRIGRKPRACKKNEANLNKCLVQDLIPLAPFDETKVRAADKEQLGSNGKKKPFPVG